MRVFLLVLALTITNDPAMDHNFSGMWNTTLPWLKVFTHVSDGSKKLSAIASVENDKRKLSFKLNGNVKEEEGILKYNLVTNHVYITKDECYSVFKIFGFGILKHHKFDTKSVIVFIKDCKGKKSYDYIDLNGIWTRDNIAHVLKEIDSGIK